MVSPANISGCGVPIDDCVGLSTVEGSCTSVPDVEETMVGATLVSITAGEIESSACADDWPNK